MWARRASGAAQVVVIVKNTYIVSKKGPHVIGIYIFCKRGLHVVTSGIDLGLHGRLIMPAGGG